MKPGVVAAIVTHRRPDELRRLLESLASSTLPLLGCVISDHAPDGTTRRLGAETPFPTLVLEDASNPGPGAGWAHAAQKAVAHFGASLEAVWYLDDDVVIPPRALEILRAEMEAASAAAIAPLLEDASGQLWAFPEPRPSNLRQPIRQARTATEALQLLGERPIPFCWCTGACFLVGKEALAAGWHRTDFFILGEDLEYSMRIAARHHAVFTCKVSVPHLPPTAAPSSLDAGWVKFQSLLRNLCYLAFHSPCSGHLRSYLPGNFRRFFRTYGWSPRTLRTAAVCFWQGAVLGRPAGWRSS